MKQRKILPGIEASSGNVFADLGLPDADELLLKSDLAIGIKRIIERRKLTQTDAARIIGIPQPRLSRILRGHLELVSEGKLIDCLNRLGENVRITYGPAPKGTPGQAWVENSSRVISRQHDAA